MNPIQNVPAPPVSPGQLPGASNLERPSTAFKDFLLDSIQEVNAMQQDADRAVEKLAGGGESNPAEVLTAVQKADIAFRMMIQVRNKLVQAYDEVKNMRI